MRRHQYMPKAFQSITFMITMSTSVANMKYSEMRYTDTVSVPSPAAATAPREPMAENCVVQSFVRRFSLLTCRSARNTIAPASAKNNPKSHT